MKRLLDVAAATLGLAILLVPLLVIALLVCVRMGRPVLHPATRAGLHGRPFRMYKFRTMRDLVDERGRPLPDRERITPFGRFLRRTSLDELPELLNVLKGDMSLVGPRPLLLQYVPLYTPEQARRLDVRPGITGLAQIQGRNGVAWEARFAHDVWYVDHASLRLDLQILARTIRQVLHRDGVSADGDLDVPFFQGSERA
ncbi:MAG TPA: sugar transferase [Gemmatimonadaceae bacterium]|jgi:lipopolysaccharide/colanic/teichoic acid biosynthesis glycosyltransferase|nr:sugar transferase [Gemmatimonadaceae bacterium]